ncbi:magnesium and cobalt transport protein CorA [Paenibacillus yanchengensis]|uniref:Magnesium and cobalt transport protein CorA n=1 Tax=Paenibacillus yanchengensis TaxID=2035833 RepID=A0ABW4YHX5_9BACL
MKEHTPKERLYWLLQLFGSRQIDMDNFCNEFHVTFDHDTDYDELTSEENKLFEDLARSAARFSGSIEDHMNHPRVYTTEDEISDKVSDIVKALNI